MLVSNFVTLEQFGGKADGTMDGGGTDNAPAFAAAIATGKPIVLGPGTYAINSTVDVSNLVGVSIMGSWQGRRGPVRPSEGTWILWQGPAGGTMFNLRGMNYLIDGIGFACIHSTSLDRVFNVDAPDATSGLISTEHLFQNLSVWGFGGPIAKGWVVGEVGRQNNEFHRWQSCSTRYCTYAAVQELDPSGQVKNLQFEDCSFGGNNTGTDYGVVFVRASAGFNRCNFDALGCGVKWFDGSFEPCYFKFCSSESCRQMISAGGVKALMLECCRFACNLAPNPQVFSQEFIAGAANLHIVGCEFEEPDTLTGFIRPGNGGTLTVATMQFHSTQPFSADGQTTWRGNFANVRFNAGNNLYPDGPCYQRFVPNLVHAGNGIVLTDGHYPMNVTYSGGTPAFGQGTARLYLDSGHLWASINGGPPVQLS